MSRYSLAVRTSGASITTPAWEIRSASTDRPRILEIGVFIASAVAAVVGLGRPAAIGVTPTSPVTVLGEEPGDPAATVTSALAWGTPPTAPTNFLRRWAGPATIGAGIIWTFPQGLILPVSSSLVLWNITANPVFDAYVLLDE